MDIECSINAVDNHEIVDADNSNNEIKEDPTDKQEILSDNNVESMNIKSPICENVSEVINMDNTELINNTVCLNSENQPEIIENDNLNTEIICDKTVNYETKIIDNNTESIVPQSSVVLSKSEVPKVAESPIQMSNALRSIASAYCDSSDDEEEISIVQERITISDTLESRNHRYNKSDNTYSEDSSSSSSSDSSSSDSSAESTNEVDSDNDDDYSTPCNNRRQNKKQEKGEYDDLPPIEDLQISVPEVVCDPLGKVGWMVEQMVVVTPERLKPTLNIDTVLFIERGRRVLGRIFDVFGPVSEPHYCVRFNNSEHIKANKIQVGMTVYYCPNTIHTTLVFMTDLLKMKATDDIGDDEHPAFSDDEEERAYYASLKHKKMNDKGNRNENNGEIPKKRPRNNANNTGWKSKHPWNERRPRNNYYETNNYNNMHQQNLPLAYNLWQSNSIFHNNTQPLSNMGSEPHNHSSSLFQSNVQFPWQTRPNLAWPNNVISTPTQTQNTPWCSRTLPSCSPPPPGV